MSETDGRGPEKERMNYTVCGGNREIETYREIGGHGINCVQENGNMLRGDGSLIGMGKDE